VVLPLGVASEGCTADDVGSRNTCVDTQSDVGIPYVRLIVRELADCFGSIVELLRLGHSPGGRSRSAQHNSRRSLVHLPLHRATECVNVAHKFEAITSGVYEHTLTRPQLLDLVLSILKHSSVIPRPIGNVCLKLEDLLSPVRIVHIAAVGSHDQNVDVAGGVSLAASHRSEKNGECGRGWPARDGVLQPFDQESSEIGKCFDRWRRDMVSVQPIPEGAPNLVTNDDPLIN
jgi:hypothetical protein